MRLEREDLTWKGDGGLKHVYRVTLIIYSGLSLGLW